MGQGLGERLWRRLGFGCGSGKSWLASYLKRRLGARATVVSLDWYYRDHGGLPPEKAAKLWTPNLWDFWSLASVAIFHDLKSSQAAVTYCEEIRSSA